MVEQPLTLFQVRRGSDLIDGAMSEKTASFVLAAPLEPSSLITSRNSSSSVRRASVVI